MSQKQHEKHTSKKAQNQHPTLLPNDSQNMGQTFKVINYKQQKIRFLAVDKCLFFDGEPDFPKCDCILYNDKYFCFIELKEITSHSINTRKQAKKQARKQLISTINKLQSAIRFDDMILEAYVCVGYQANRPAIRASDQNVKLKFETLKTTLFNGCQKCFDDD